MIITGAGPVRELYAMASRNGWVLPCFCTENLTTTEAILSAAAEFAQRRGITGLPVTVAITCRYHDRPQAMHYTHTRRWDTGIRLFLADLTVLCQAGGPFESLKVMAHLDHIQHDDDGALLEWDLSGFSSIMYDASTLPFGRNIELTARFVEKMQGTLLVEGACDEIASAGGACKNELTTPDKAEAYLAGTGADLIVANLGTEHRAGAKDLQYRPDAARAIRDRIGGRVVLHGASSVPEEQIRSLFSDGVRKVNVWTALERDASPALFESLVTHATQAAGSEMVNRLVAGGWLGSRCADGASMSLDHCATTARQQIVFERMKQIVLSYLELWYV